VRILRASGRNFQSYQEIEFDYSGLGLALISGPTGAGKSTLLDLVSWTLFGVTSKEVAADDVRSWDAEDITEATISVQMADKIIEVTRTRSPGKNDLYWEESGAVFRGKDLTETQKLLDTRLSCSADLFMLSSYFSQFSKADSFFIAKAKDRREVLEKIADQEWAIALGEKASDVKKAKKKERDDLELKLNKTQGRRDALAEQADRIGASILDWYKKHGDKIRVLNQKFDTFDQDKAAKISKLRQELDAAPLSPAIPLTQAEADLSVLRQSITRLRSSSNAPCDKCGSPVQDAHKREKIEALEREYELKRDKLEADRHSNFNADAQLKYVVSTQAALARISDETNPYGDQLEAAKAEINPFEAQQTEVLDNLYVAQATTDALADDLKAAETQVSRLNWLYDASMTLRGLLMQRAVSQLQDKTNDYLERFFDASLRVQFTLEDSDKLDVEISNNGHNCPWKALSGGERGILKLAFSVALMRAAQDKAGIKFDSLFFDEALNGLDDGLKVKAFGLLEELEQEYGTVLVIDHCEALKAKFNKTFEVTKAGSHSEVHES
jgi:DNA repair exonuclease SbcCD ATPase subunit